MKHDYKFRVDEPQPSEEDIDRHRNFEGLLNDYRNLTTPLYRRPLYKNPRTFLGLVMILAIGFLVFEAVEEEETAKKLAETPVEVREAEKNAFLESASEAFSSQQIEFYIPGERDTTLALPSGLQLIVDHAPSGDSSYPRLRLSVTELQDPLDALLNGVPLQAEPGSQLLPRHAIHISTSQNFPSGTQFRVEFPPQSNRPDQAAVLYTLDTAQRIWTAQPDRIDIEEKPIPSENQGALNDGFGVMEFNEDGSVTVEHVEVNEENGKTEWVRSYLARPNDWLLCGTPSRQAAADIQIQLVDGSGSPAELYALYQMVDNGNSVRVYWPEDGEFNFKVAKGEQVFAFQSNGQLVWAEIPEAGGSVSYQVSGDVVATKDELKKFLGIPTADGQP